MGFANTGAHRASGTLFRTAYDAAHERIVQARAAAQMLFARGDGDRIPEESRDLLPAFCEEYLNNWLFKAAASDGQHPRFVCNFMPAHAWHGHEVPGTRTGGDNPDNCYRLAGIEHGTHYRVTGRIVDAKPVNISFTLTANYGTSQTIQTIEDHEIDIAPDGTFEIRIDDRPFVGEKGHLSSRGETVKFLFVRDSIMDWSSETSQELHIERLGDPRADPITREEMAARAAQHALGDLYLYFWFKNVWSGLTPNSITPAQAMRGAGGGLVTQGLCNGTFDLGDDDAAIIEYDPAGAGYAAAQLTEWLYRSLDYHRIQSSLTAAQSAVDGDGLIRLVIARRDPGGQQHVHLIMRWQLMPPEGRPIAARLQMTTIDRLKDHLPAGTRWVDRDERQALLAARLAAYQRRITG